MTNKSQEFYTMEDVEGPSFRKRKYPFRDDSPGEQSSQPLFATYKKKQGIGQHLGGEYQVLMCALYALKLCQDPRITDFEITTNNDFYKVFDDISIRIYFKNGATETVLFQLKHGEPKRNLTQADFVRANLKNKSYLKNPFCLAKHTEYLGTIDGGTTCVLLTNNSTSLCDGLELNCEGTRIIVKSCLDLNETALFVNTETVELRDIFKVGNHWRQFYFLTNQNNVHGVRRRLEKELRKLQHCDSYGFFDFMKNWWSQNFVLTKTDVLTKLTEFALWPFKTLSGDKQNYVSERLSQTIMAFDTTIIDASAETIVTKIWKDAKNLLQIVKHEFSDFRLPLSTVCIAALKFGVKTHSIGEDRLTFAEQHEIVASLSEDQIARVLWYLDLVPLVVEQRENVNRVLEMWEDHLPKRKFVLIGKGRPQKSKVFFTLSDLRNEDIEGYSWLMDHCYVSVQGRESTPLKSFSKYPGFDDVITVTELLKMTQAPLVIGKHEKVDFYVGRTLTTVFVDTEKLLRVSDDIVVIINNFDSDIKTVKLLDYLANPEMNGDTQFISSTTKCTLEQFEAVVQISQKPTYLFEVYNKDSCILLLKKGDVLNIKEIMVEHHVKDLEALKHFGTFNVINGPQGSGKTTMLKLLSTRCPPDLWSLCINLQKHDSSQLCLPDLNEDTFVSKFKKFLVEAKKVSFFLDNADRDFEDILRFAKKGTSVWVASRDELRSDVVPIKIDDFGTEQQKEFLFRGLRSLYSIQEVEKVLDVIFRSVGRTNSDHLLATPRFLTILIDFLKDRTRFEKIQYEGVFAVSVMYRWFFDSVFGRHYSEKNLDVEDLEFLKRRKVENYQKLALGQSDSVKSDKLGFVQSTEGHSEFLHNQFREYFAASWWSQNSSDLCSQYFTEAFRGIRLILDTILAEDHFSHLSVIYNNFKEVRDDGKDKGGRSVLHLACSYGTVSSGFNRLTRDPLIYNELLEKLFKTLNVWDRDELLGITALDYALRSGCLLPVEKILATQTVDWSVLIQNFDSKTLAFYASQMGYYNLFVMVLKNDPQVLEERFGDLSLVEVAVLGAQNEDYSVSREGNIKIVKKLVEQKGSELLEVMRFASAHNCFDIIKILSELDSEVFNKPTMFKLFQDDALQKNNVDVLKLLLSIKNVNAVDENKRTLLHHAVMSHSNVEVIRFLLEKGSDINIADSEGRTALYYARKFSSDDCVKLLMKGLDWKREENQLSHVFNTLTFGKASTSRRVETGDDLPMKQVFRKRPGTTDFGRDYELLVMSELCLKLLVDPSVLDFFIWSNDETFGYFDDVILRIQSEHHSNFAIQIKHSMTDKRLRADQLTSQKGNFSLPRLINSFQKTSEFPYNFVVFTNVKCNLSDSFRLTLKDGDVEVRVKEHTPESFLNTSEKGKCYVFEVVSPGETKYKDFFSRFYLYTDQKNFHSLKEKSERYFVSTFHCKPLVYEIFFKFIFTWNYTEGIKEMLNKTWSQNIVALTILDPYIQPLLFGPVNEKMALLRQALSFFPLTVLDQESESVRSLWGDQQHHTDSIEAKKVASKYQLRHVSPGDEKILWLLGKCPLVVTESPCVQSVIDLCPGWFILLKSNAESLSWNLRDLFYKSPEIYTSVLKTFKWSLQQKQEYDFEHLVSIDSRFPTLITVNDLLEMLKEVIVGAKEDLSFCYITRFLSRPVVPGGSLEYGNLERMQDVSHEVDDNVISETDLCIDHRLSLVVADPGMGKTQLLRSLSNRFPLLSVIIYSWEVPTLLKEGTMRDFVLNTKFPQARSIEKKILSFLIDHNEVVLLWDALDELSDISSCVEIIKMLQKREVTQWVTCRSHFKTLLEKEFSVVAYTLRPLTTEQQSHYLKQYGYFRDTTFGLPKLDDLFSSPLQLCMLTEVLRENPKIEIFDLYRSFLERKYDAYFQKFNFNLEDPLLRQFYDKFKTDLVEKYERLAVRLLLPEVEVSGDGISEDNFGLLSHDRTFVHLSFAEYFAAVYLTKNRPENLKVIFEENHANIRFFFDSLLGKESHIAVLRHDFEALKKSDKSKDDGGRSALHIAAAWGRRYPRLQMREQDGVYIIDGDFDDVTEPKLYTKILDYLLGNCDSDVDELFKETPLWYASTTNCLLAKLKLLCKEKRRFQNVDDSLVDVLYFSAKVGCDEMLDLFDNVPLLVTKDGNTLLHLSVGFYRYLEKLLEFDAYKTAINYQNRKGETALHWACLNANSESIRVLFSCGGDISSKDCNGATPLYVAMMKGAEDCVKTLLELGAKK